MNMNRRTSSTGGRSIDARCALIDGPNSASQLFASSVVEHAPAEDHVPMGDGRLLGHGPRHEVRHRGRQDHVAPLGRRGDRVVLRGDELRHASWSAPRPSKGVPRSATAARTAPSERRTGPGARRTPRPEGRTSAPPHPVPAAGPRAPPSVRRPLATRTSTTTRAFHTPKFVHHRLRPVILRHHQGLAASPQVRYTLNMEGSFRLPSFCLPRHRVGSSRPSVP